MKHPKVVVLGAGSLFFGRQAIWQMVHSPHLNKGTLSLVDTNADRLNKLVTLAKMVAKENNVPLKIEGSTNRLDVLDGADFVILSFANNTVKYRGIDCKISEKYGIRMCSGDTIGPGGIFRAMRELPEIMACAKDIQDVCPDAWVINYINPSTVHGMALKRYWPKLKSFALCDSHHMPHKKILYAERAGMIKNENDYNETIDKQFDLRIAGVNHFTWLLKAEYQGKDVAPLIADSLRKSGETETVGGDVGAKALFNDAISYQLYEIFGYVPTCTAHTKEYVPYWQGLGTKESIIPPLSIWETEERYERHDEMWQEIDDFLSGKTPIKDYINRYGPDHATDVIESMVSGSDQTFYINTQNNGAVTNMSDDAFLELLCDVSMDGITPLHVGELPRGIRGLQEVVLDTHELTAQAVVENDPIKLRRAMLTDPLIHSIEDADQIIKELLEAEKEAIAFKI